MFLLLSGSFFLRVLCVVLALVVVVSRNDLPQNLTVTDKLI